MTGLPLTSRLRKSQTSYPSNLEVPQENPTFFPAAAVCPFFSRTEILNSVSHRIIMIYTSLRCVLNISLSLIKIRSHLFGKPVLVCRTLEKASTHWPNFAFVSKPRERKKEKKIHERKHPKHVFLKTNYSRFPISSNTLIIRTPLTVLESPPENCSSSSNSHVFFQTDF